MRDYLSKHKHRQVHFTTHEKVSSCIVLVLRSYLRRSSPCERHLQKASSHYISWRFCAHYTMTGAILGTLTRLTLFATGIAACFASSGKRWLQVFFIIVRKLSYALYFCLGFICSQWMKSRFYYADESHTYHMIFIKRDDDANFQNLYAICVFRVIFTNFSDYCGLH